MAVVAAALLWSAFALPALVKYPIDLDVTSHYESDFTCSSTRRRRRHRHARRRRRLAHDGSQEGTHCHRRRQERRPRAAVEKHYADIIERMYG
jgi:hypothetical protein